MGQENAHWTVVDLAKPGVSLGEPLDQLAHALAGRSTECLRSDDGTALAVRWSGLQSAAVEGTLKLETAPEFGEPDPVVFLSTSEYAVSVRDLEIALDSAGMGRPAAFGVPMDDPERRIGDSLDDAPVQTSVGRLSIDSGGHMTAFRLYRPASEDAPSNTPLNPFPQKVPEGPGNLGRREGWFERRTGSRAR